MTRSSPHGGAGNGRPILLDAFCGAGGCTKGYQRAGFYVVGVDIAEQPNYCGDEFHQADALEVLRILLSGGTWQGYRLEDFDAIHASPPCQGYTSMSRRHAEARDAHPRLIAEVRERLRATGLPYVIENVPGARTELRQPVQLCSRGFGLGVGRHRLYECSFPVMSVQCQCNGREVPVYGKLDGRRLWTRKDGTELRAARTLEQASEAMGIGWMTWDELREAIPPAHTEHIGSYLMAHLDAEARSAA